MSKILDLQKRAKSLLSQHQNDIDKTLDREISQIFSDIKNTVQREEKGLNSSIETMKKNIQKKQSEVTAEILQQQQANLQELNNLNLDIALSAKLKKTLITSNIVLISLACITLISSICFAYVSNSKYNDIKAMQNKVDYLKSQGGSMMTMNCGEKLCVELDPTVKETYALENGTRPLGVVKEVR